eukprot:28299_1
MCVLLLLLALVNIAWSVDNIPINIFNLGLKYDGLGGLDAVGGARLLFEYPEPTRTQILDLLFKPNYGANWQILKSEINGDCDSSYGSGSSFLHTRNDSNPNRWNRGTHHWMLQEAMKRNPDIILYALSWCVPYWVGNGTFLSQDGVDYHVNWLLGMIKNYNATYHYMGIWNEDNYTKDYIIALSKTLKRTQELKDTLVIAADHHINPILDDMYSNSSVRESVDVIGVHTILFNNTTPQELNYLNIMINKHNKKLWNSENNMLDGAYPKWDAYAIPWVRSQIHNYIFENSTATILCPIAHSWSMNYGLHNHGHSTFIEPWSGYYELGAPFWSQAHITQFTKPGFYFLSSPATDTIKSTNVYYATYVDIDNRIDKNVIDFSIVITNEDMREYYLIFELQNGFERYSNTDLQHWKTDEFDWFSQQDTISIDSNNRFVVRIPEMSILTVSTLINAQHKTYPIPNRFQFPIPLCLTFDDQQLGEPGKRLSDLYGAFEVNIDPNSNSSNYVLKQAVPVTPGTNAWKDRNNNPLPISTFPSGTNWANYNISAYVLCENIRDTVMLCGRIPMWTSSGYELNYALGVCLILEFGTGNWKLTENTMQGQTTLTEVFISDDGKINEWSYISLGFDDGKVQAIVGNQISLQYEIQSLTGVSGIGSAHFNIAYYDNITLQLNNKHLITPNGSYILDCLVGNSTYIMNSFDGYVGFILSMKNASKSLIIKQLGRFKVTNKYNNYHHEMNVIHVLENNKYKFLLDISYSIDMKNCVTDLNGFCYTQTIINPIQLEVDEIYYIVSKESKGRDYFVNMTDPATGSTMNHRNGNTYMSYLAPNKGKIIGRVLFHENTQTASIIEEIDTSYGPVNFVLDTSN